MLAMHQGSLFLNTVVNYSSNFDPTISRYKNQGKLLQYFKFDTRDQDYQKYRGNILQLQGKYGCNIVS
jgi:hypothetical protein